jgi:Flp pilus assembly protein TadB
LSASELPVVAAAFVFALAEAAVSLPVVPDVVLALLLLLPQLIMNVAAAKRSTSFFIFNRV